MQQGGSPLAVEGDSGLARAPAGRGDDIQAPLFLLAPPRSFTSVACAMLGEHPAMYGVCELHLMRAASVGEWLWMCGEASFGMSDGLLRVIAELQFGGQTEANVTRAFGWIRRRAHWTTGFMLEHVARLVAPRILVEKSPSTVYQAEYMQRARDLFPDARFLHLTRNPVSHGDSLMALIRAAEERSHVPQWMLSLAGYGQSEPGAPSGDLNPQHGWYHLNANICRFLDTVPQTQQFRVRGEDLLNDTDRVLGEIAAWLGLDRDGDALEKMKHPERSPYAKFGPPNARMGNDGAFMSQPRLRSERATVRRLDEPVPWSDQGRLTEDVVSLARSLGYV